MDETTKPTRRQQGALNQRQIKSLDIAAQVAASAKKAPYKDALATRDATPTLVGGLDNEALACREEIARAVESDTAGRLSTAAESDARKALLRGNRNIQIAARQKFARTTPEALKDYYVGEKLAAMNRATLVQATDGILLRLTNQSLPGINASAITELKARRDAYVAANDAQLGHTSAARAHREAALKRLKAATDLRLTVQFAADGLYPHDDPASAPARTEFHLPPNRRLTVP